jgi:hypothetical protein
LPRTPDLWVVNKCDDRAQATDEDDHDAGLAPSMPLRISAAQQLGLHTLQQRVLARLGLGVPGDDLPWAFSPTLQDWAAGTGANIDTYLSEAEAGQ